MALVNTCIYSKELKKNVHVSVVLPLPNITNMEYGDNVTLLKENEKYRTLWLIHPQNADHSMLIYRTRIEAYAKEKRIAVVMMDIDNSYGCNIENVGNYYSFLSTELPLTLRAVFPLSAKREDNFIGGIGMGAFAALMIAAKNTENYSLAFSIAGQLTIDENSKKLICGTENQNYKELDHNLECILLNSQKAQDPVQYYFCQNQNHCCEKSMIDRLISQGLSIHYEETSFDENFESYDLYLHKMLQICI